MPCLPRHRERLDSQWRSFHHLLAAILALLIAGCANTQQGGSYQYSFDNHFEIKISTEYKYLGKVQAASDSITIVGGSPHPINRCNGYVVMEAYYTGNDINLEELLVVYRDNSACTWDKAFSELDDSYLTLCADSEGRYAKKINELAAAAGKTLSGCYDGISTYGYFGKRTLHVVYMFISQEKIKSSGKDSKEALQARMMSAVTRLP